MGRNSNLLQLLCGIWLVSLCSGSDVAFCSRSKCSGSSRLDYKAMTSYFYSYNVDVAALIDGSDKPQESRIHLTTNVRIDLHNPCDWTLRLYNTTLQDSNPLDANSKAAVPGEQNFKTLLEQFALALSFDDGLVSAVCPANGDPAWSVNIKRGILSTLQNTMPRFDLDNHSARESDVTGTCDVTYSFDSVAGNRVKIAKTRHLSSCSDRHNVARSIVSAVPYHFPGDYDSLPMMDSTSICKQTIVSRRVVASQCEERHVVRAFSHGQSGAVTTSKQTLDLIEAVELDVTDDADVTEADIAGRYSLLYQHENVTVTEEQVDDGKSAYSTLTVLRALCDSTAFGVSSEAPEYFAKLTRILRSFKYASIVELLSRPDDLCRDGNAARNLLLNALISVGSSDAFAAIADVVISGQMDADLVNRWTTSLSSAPRLSVKHLEAVLPLLDLPSSSRPQRLGLRISSMVKKLCSTEQCSHLAEVSKFIGKLSRTLLDSCRTRSREERVDVVMSLKSLANVGAALKSSHVDTLESCLEEKDNPAEVRIAALQGLANVECGMKGNAAKKILADVSEDSEIRIAAYLAMMKCPDFRTILHMKELLLTEEMNQVGSFIWTHLQNLAKTSLPSKASVQALVVDQVLVNKFNSDVRKFSRNLEYSLFFDEINAGGSLESNVVFSQHSYLPRSAWLNFTVDAFGKSINIFEMDGRMEGFERYIESLFGPGGVYDDQGGVGNILGSLLQRPKRRAHPPGLNSEKLSAMDQQFDAASHFRDEPQMSLSMKVMGRELGYGHWEGSDEIMRSISQLDPVTYIQRLMSGEEVSFTYAGDVLDASYVVPLASGLPLRLEGRANVVADARGSVNADLSALLSRASAQLTWKMHPSAAANFDASLTVFTPFIQAGVKLVTNLHSSVSTSGSLKLEGFKLIDLKVDFPQNEADIIHFKSEIQLMHSYPDSKVITLNGIADREDYSSCTKGNMFRFLGLKICAKASYPNATSTPNVGHFPLTGKSDFHVNLVKVDQNVTSYRFLHHIENEESLKSWALTFQPGDDGRKEVGIKTHVKFNNFESADMALSLKLPDNTYELKGLYVWDDEDADDGPKRSDREKWPTYRPKLTLTYLDRKLVDLHGSVRMKKADGSVQCDVDIDAAVGSLKTSTTGYYLVTGSSYVSNLTLEYRSAASRRSENIKLEVKLEDELSEEELRQWDVHLGVEWSASPDTNFIGTWKMKQGQGRLDNMATFNRGATSRDSHYTLTLAQSFNYDMSIENHRLHNRLHVSLPAKGVDMELAVDYLHSNFVMDTFFLARLAPQKEMQCGLQLRRTPGVLLQVDGAFNLTLPSQPTVKIQGRLNETSKDIFKVDMDGQLGADSDFMLIGNYEQSSGQPMASQDLNIEVTGSMMYPMEITYFWQANSTLFEAQLQTSYGEDSVSLSFSRDLPSKEEMKLIGRIGYANFLHSVELYLNNRPEQLKATLDVHVDKVLDMRGDFSRTLERSSGRRDTSVEFSWNANRNPLQKLVIRTLLEPSVMNPNDWNAMIQLNYPGTFLRCNLEALTQRGERLITGTVDFGSKGAVIVTSRSYLRSDAILAELIVETPFAGYKLNKALFTSSTENGGHRTALTTTWGSDQFVEMELAAKRISDGLESVEAILSCKSSLESLQLWKIVARSELDFNTLDSHVTVEWGDEKEKVELISNLEWAFDGHVTVKSDTTLTTPFESLSLAKMQLHQTIEWDLTNVFETKLLFAVNSLHYDTLVRVERPTGSERWELTALMTTPHQQYPKMGVSCVGVATHNRPSMELNFYWPEKDVSLVLAANYQRPEQVRATFALKTPLPRISRVSIDAGYALLPPSAVKMDISTSWNQEDYVKVDVSVALEGQGSNGAEVLASLDTSFDAHQRYATAAGYLAVDDEYTVFAQLEIPDYKIGVNASTSETETEEGEMMTRSLVLDLTGYPVAKMDFNRLKSAEAAGYTSLALHNGEQSVTLRHEDYMEEEVWVNQLRISSMKMPIPEGVVTIRYRNQQSRAEPEAEIDFNSDASNDDDDQGDDDQGGIPEEPEDSAANENELLISLLAVWSQPGEDMSKVEVVIQSSSSFEEKEDFTSESEWKYLLTVESPWEVVRQLTTELSSRDADAHIHPLLRLVYNDDSVHVAGVVILSEATSVMSLTRRSQDLPRGETVYRMNSTWDVEDDGITVEGTLETELEDYPLVHWKLTQAKDASVDKVELFIDLDHYGVISTTLEVTPTQVSVTLETPFAGWESNSMSCLYETVDDRIDFNAEVHLTSQDQFYHVGGHCRWPEDYRMAQELSLTIESPHLDKEILLKIDSDVVGQVLTGTVKATAELSDYIVNSDVVFDFESERPKMNFSVSVTDAVILDDVHYILRVAFDVPEEKDIIGHLTVIAPSLIPDAVKLDVQLHHDEQGNLNLTTSYDVPTINGRVSVAMDDRDDSIAADLALNYQRVYVLQATSDLKSGVNDVSFDVNAQWPADSSTQQTLSSALELKDGSKVTWRTQSFRKTAGEVVIDEDEDVGEEEEEEADRWSLDVQLDASDWTKSYSHNITYTPVKDPYDVEEVKYATTGRMLNENRKRMGQLSIQWPEFEPFDVEFALETKAKRVGVAELVMRTPWTSSQPSLELNVDVDGSRLPVAVVVKAQGAAKKVVVDVDVSIDPTRSVAAKTDVRTTYSWLPTAHMEVNHVSTAESFNGSYAFQWADKHSLAIDLFDEQRPNDVNLLVPFNTTRNIKVNTSLKRLPEVSVSYTRGSSSPTDAETALKVGRNGTTIFHSVSRTALESSAGLELSTWTLQLVEGMRSGVEYQRRFEYSGGHGGSNLPTSLTRSVELFRIDQRHKNMFHGELTQKQSSSGAEYGVKLTSPIFIRTVELSTYIDQPDGVFKHGSQFRWNSNQDDKIGYEIHIENRTTEATSHYVMTASLDTPVRGMALTSTLKAKDRDLRALTEIVWDLKRSESVAIVDLDWRDVTNIHHVTADRIQMRFRQGTLPQELSVVSLVQRGAGKPLSIRTEVQYSKEPQRNVGIDVILASGAGHFRTEMNVTHPATQLDMRHVVSYVKTNATAQVIHSFSHQCAGSKLLVVEHLASVDMVERKVFLSATSNQQPWLSIRHQGQVTYRNGAHVIAYETRFNDRIQEVLELNIDHKLPLFHLLLSRQANAGSTTADQSMHLRAGIPDKRQAIVEWYRLDNEQRIRYFDFFFRLDHSRLVTSQMHWNTELGSELKQRAALLRYAARSKLQRWVTSFAQPALKQAKASVKVIGQDIDRVLQAALVNFNKEFTLLRLDYGRMEQKVADGYEANAFFVKVIKDLGGKIINGIPFKQYAGEAYVYIEGTGNRLLKSVTQEEDSFSRLLEALQQQLEVVSQGITRWLDNRWRSSSSRTPSRLSEKISEMLEEFAFQYDEIVKDIQLRLEEILAEISTTLRLITADVSREVYKTLQPIALQFYITTETAVWTVVKELLDYFYDQREALVDSTYFQKLSQLIADVQQFYKDLGDGNVASKMKQHLADAAVFLQMKYSELQQLVQIIDDVGKQLADIYSAFLEANPELEKGADAWRRSLEFLRWSYHYIDVEQRLSDMVVFLRRRGSELMNQSATDVYMRHREAKTRFSFEPESGSILLEQKLPFTWISFDEPPRYEDIQEIQMLNSLMKLFEPSNESFSDRIASYVPSTDVADWLPPFKGTAQMIGLQHVLTFDGRYLEFTGPCTYLLARDFLTHNFTLAVHYLDTRGKPYAAVLQLVVDGVEWDLDLSNETIRVAGQDRLLPTEEHGTMAFYDDSGNFNIQSASKGIQLQCIDTYHVCTLTLSGWYNNKVAGLFGTMDNEAMTDMILPNRVVEKDLTALARSWDVSVSESCKTTRNLARKAAAVPDPETSRLCNTFFATSTSTMKSCFSVVDASPYHHMCLIPNRNSGIEAGCQAAAAYVQACAAKSTRIRIPPNCVKCQMEANVALAEGQSKQLLQESSQRPSTDVVILFELGECNRDGSNRTFLPSLLANLEKELNANKITKNRYSLVLYGGRAPHDVARVRTYRGDHFVTSKQLRNIMQDLPEVVSDPAGSVDITGAIHLATTLNFRAAVSKTLVLMPCSSCGGSPSLPGGYRSLVQTLLGQDVTLHVIADQLFEFGKARASRQFLGLDAATGYTLKDNKGPLVGDVDLRRQARLSKSALGFCAPLALETNGTIFTASKMRPVLKKSSESKRAISVFVKRVAVTAQPGDCHNCVCSLVNYHQSWTDCRLCNTPKALDVDLTFLSEPGMKQWNARVPTKKAKRTN